jgi:hypothetical protein
VRARTDRPVGAVKSGAAVGAALLWLVPASAFAQEQPPAAPASNPAGPAPDAAAPANGVAAGESSPADSQAAPAAGAADSQPASQTDIFSKNTITILLDARLVVANGSRSFVNGGFGKTRFQGQRDGDYKPRLVPVEADLVWQPRFTASLSATVSAAWQRDQEHDFDLIEAFVNFVPQSSANVTFSARAGLMWPEISLEHSTGGAWSVVNTITPSAINAWVGEETKVVGVEGTLRASLGQHQLAATGGVFGFNDTSGTLLSFRGWALHDIRATGFGHFPLPPLNPFIRLLQEDRTRSTIDIDKRVGYYARLEWRPPDPYGFSLFYYDNRGDPEAFFSSGQWGWRTRFWNLGFNADLGPNTRFLAQGMTGSTIMGFPHNGVRWVHTYFSSAYALVTHSLTDRLAMTGRVEGFNTRERGSEMERANSEHGFAATAAARLGVTDNLTGFLEALHVRSHRGTRVTLEGLRSPFEAQTVIQAALRLRL